VDRRAVVPAVATVIRFVPRPPTPTPTTPYNSMHKRGEVDAPDDCDAAGVTVILTVPDTAAPEVPRPISTIGPPFGSPRYRIAVHVTGGCCVHPLFATRNVIVYADKSVVTACTFAPSRTGLAQPTPDQAAGAAGIAVVVAVACGTIRCVAPPAEAAGNDICVATELAPPTAVACISFVVADQPDEVIVVNWSAIAFGT